MNYCIGGLQYGSFLWQIKETYDKAFGKAVNEDDDIEEEITTTKIEAVNVKLEESFNWIKKEAIHYKTSRNDIYYIANESLKGREDIKEIEYLLSSYLWTRQDLKLRIDGKQKHMRNVRQISCKDFESWKIDDQKLKVKAREEALETVEEAREEALETVEEAREDVREVRERRLVLRNIHRKMTWERAFREGY